MNQSDKAVMQEALRVLIRYSADTFDSGNQIVAALRKAIAQPVEPHDLQKRLEALHQYEDVAEHYAKCAISPEALRDWVAERMDMPAIAQSVEPDDLTIAYMSGLADGKKAAQPKETK